MSQQSIMRLLGGLACEFAHIRTAVGHKNLSRSLAEAMLEENCFWSASSNLPLYKRLSLLNQLPSMSKYVREPFVEFRGQSTYVFN